MSTIFSHWKRRIVTLSIWFFAATILVVAAPIWIIVAFIYDIIKKKNWIALRTMTFFTLFFWADSIGVIWSFFLWLGKPFFKSEHSFRWENRRIQRWFANVLTTGATRIFGVSVEVEGAELLRDETPTLIFPRHASVADTMFPLAFSPIQKNMRHVLKAELLNDPGLDIVGHRFPNIFVKRGSNNPQKEIERVVSLSKDLPNNSAVVIFPEGTRFSQEKRERLLEKFKDSNPKFYAITQTLKKTLSPLRGGGIALIQAMPPDSDIVFISHRGIDRAGSFDNLINGGFTNTKLEVKIWRVKGKDIPRDPEGAEKFLFESWLKVDAWAQGKRIEDAPSVEDIQQTFPEITFSSPTKTQVQPQPEPKEQTSPT